MTISRKTKATLEFLDSLRDEPLTFGEYLRSIRICDEISQAELARRMNMSKSHLCDIENNRRTVSFEKAAEFARVLGYSEQQFVEMVIETQLRNANMPFVVELKKAA